MKKNIILIWLMAVIGIAGAVLVFLIIKSNQKDGLRMTPDAAAGEDFIEYCGIGYGDIISEIVQGYKSHWEDVDPSELELSSVYRMESDCCGFAQTDINGDGVDELLIGDDFGDSYVLYDIYTFNRWTGDTVHLLSGGERDSFVINGSGVIIENGSNSAFDSFTKYYTIDDAALTEVGLKETDAVEDDLKKFQMDKFMRHVAPTMYVAVRGDELLGQLLRSFDDCYLVEGQDTVRVAKDGVDVQLWSAFDGRGIVFAAEPGALTVYAGPSDDSPVLGTVVHEEGYCPETVPCLGYSPGWFTVDFADSVGYVPEAGAAWDFIDRN